jgi:hypothetical protein
MERIKPSGAFSPTLFRDGRFEVRVSLGKVAVIVIGLMLG